MVCGLSFRSAAFEHCFWERGVELVLRQALVLVWMGVTFSLVGGAKGTSIRRMWSLFCLFRTVGKVSVSPCNHLNTVEPRLMDTLNSGHPQYNGQFRKSQLSFHSLKKPLNSDIPLLCIVDSYCDPNCTQTILNDPNLVDSRRPFRSPSLLELTT